MNYITQDILLVKRGVIAQQMNSLGIAGAGLAKLTFKQYPGAIYAYRQARPAFGSCMIFQQASGPVLAFLVGQLGYGNMSRQTNYGALSSALFQLRQTLDGREFNGLDTFFPYKIGCGLGGGDWDIVQELLEYYFPASYICKLP